MNPEEMNATGGNTGAKRVEVVTSLLLLCFSAFVVVSAMEMKIVVGSTPGPGMFPLGIGIVVGVLSASLLIENLSPKKKDKASKFSDMDGISRILLLICGLVVYAALLPTLGYIISTFAFVAYIMAVQKCGVKVTFSTAFSIALLLFLIFEIGLRTALPKGPFGF
jgi:putative tricarboxylic transport membrane protein